MFGTNNKPSLFGTQTTNTSAFGTPGFGTGASTGTTFGALQPQQQQPSLFGNTTTGFGTSAGTGLFGTQTSLFGSTPTAQQTAGFAATTPGTSSAFGSTTGLFGQANNQSQSLFGGAKFGSSISPFGASTQATPAGTPIKFNPLIGNDTMLKNGVNTNINTRHQCITCMKEYESKSLEELRLEDYQANRKGPGANSSVFGTQSTNLFNSNPSSLSFNTSTNNSIFGTNKPAFGTTTTTAPTSIFNSNFNKPASATGTTFSAFGQPQQQTPSIFGQQASTFTSQPNFFQSTQNTTTPLKPLFGTTTTQQPSLFTNTSTNAALGTNKPLFGVPSTAPFGNTSTGFSLNPTTTTTPSLFATGSMFNTSTNTSTANKTPMFNFPSQSAGGMAQTTNALGTSGSLFNSGSNIFGNTSSMFNTGTNVANNIFSGTSLQQTQNQQPAMSLQQLTASAQPSNTELLLSRLQTLPYGDSPLFQGSVKSSSASLKFTTDPKTLHQYKVNFQSAANQKLSRTPNPVNKSTSLLFDGLEEDSPFDKKSTLDIFVPRKNIKKLTLKSTEDKSKNNIVSNVNESSGAPSPGTSRNTVGSNNEQLSSQDSSKEYPADATIKDLIASRKQTPQQTKVMGAFVDDSTENVFSGRSFVAEDESYCASPSSICNPVKLKCGVVLTKSEYYTIPPLEQLDLFYDASNNICLLDTFTIGRHGYGSVYWEGPVDVQGLNLDDIVHFRRKEVIIYPDDQDKPPEGEGLNRPAQITLHQVWPIDKTTHEIIKDIDRLRAMRYAEKIENATVKLGANFKEYRPETGSWVFTVRHFSKYGLDDSDGEEESATNAASDASPNAAATLGLGNRCKTSFTAAQGNSTFGTVEQSVLFGHADEEGMDFKENVVEHMYAGKDLFKTRSKTVGEDDENLLSLPAANVLPDFREQLKTMDKNQIIDPDLFDMGHPTTQLSLKIDGEPKAKEELFFHSFLSDKHSAMRSAMFDDFPEENDYGTRENNYKKPKKFTSFYEEPLPESLVAEKPRTVLKRDLCLLVSTFAAKNKISCDISTFVPPLCRVNFFNGSNNFMTISGSTVTVNSLNIVPPCNDHVQRFEIHCNEYSLITSQATPLIQTKKCANNPHNVLKLEKFVKAFYGDLKPLDGYSKEQQRLNNIIDWLCEQTSAVRKPVDPLKAILYHLAANDVKSAVEIAINNRYFKLALLMSSGSSVSVKESLILQLDSWKKSGADKFISKDLLKLYVLLSGGVTWYLSSSTRVDVLEDLNWMQQMSIMLVFMSHGGLADCIDHFTAETNDVEYHLLADHSPWIALSSCENDLESWFLHQSLESYGVISVTDPMSDVIHGILASQLLSKNIRWACFVACHIRDDVLREHVVNELIFRSVSSFTVEDEQWLAGCLLISPESIAQSRAVYSRNCFDFSKTAVYLMQSQQWKEAHDVLVEHIFPELVINDQHDVLSELLETLKKHKEDIRNWYTSGANTYDTYCKIVKEKAVDANTLSSFNVHMMACNNNRHVLCQSEMARKVGLIHVSLTGGTFALNTPMPDDYVFQEMKHNCKLLLSQLCN